MEPGLGSFILVRKQIANEVKWGEAMAAIAEEFKGEAAGPGAIIGPLLIDRLDGDGADFAKLQDPAEIDLLELEEPLNFGLPHGDYTDSDWKHSCDHRRKPYSEKSLAREERRIKRDDGGEEGELAKHQYWTSVFLNLTSEQRALVASKRNDWGFSNPPMRLAFRVGKGFIELPLFARHFKACFSKISGGCGAAESVLGRIYKILKRFFPDDICFFCNGVCEEDISEEDDISAYRADLFKSALSDNAVATFGGEGAFEEIEERAAFYDRLYAVTK